MKKSILYILLAGTIISACAFSSGCSKNTKDSSDVSKAESIVSVASETTVPESSKKESAPVSEPESRTEASESSTVSETSAQSSEESSTESSTQESSEKTSDTSKMESGTEESSETEQYEGYYFDDEQIVEDYHNVQVFTDDEKFNSVFAENSIDKQFEQDIREVENESDMRTVTIRYGELWMAEAENAYNKLSALLESRPVEKEKLEKSQAEWSATLAEVESSFVKEASESEAQGTQALLAADSAMMNYYKGRAAVLYEQIFVLTGSFELD